MSVLDDSFFCQDSFLSLTFFTHHKLATPAPTPQPTDAPITSNPTNLPTPPPSPPRKYCVHLMSLFKCLLRCLFLSQISLFTHHKLATPAPTTDAPVTSAPTNPPTPPPTLNPTVPVSSGSVSFSINWLDD